MKKRILSILLICCMVLTMLPAMALAEESGQTGGGVTASGLCEHHPAHDDECGYTEGTAGTPCSHEHTDDCYTEVTDCVHEHTEDCYPQNSVSGNNATLSNADEPTECTHVCSEESGCITKQLNCQHEHDEDCGYTPATAGTSCGYVCEICGAEGNAAEAMTVERVQAMIDALPDAEEITEDNAEEVTAQLEAIDEAKAELTDEEIDELDITRYMAAAAALGSLAAPMLLANAAPAEQFNLTPGGTYWFDLSGENIPGTVNTGTSYGAVSVPDTTLHYVPFTYAGTVDAYKLTSAMATTEEYAEQNIYSHSLFVADYAVTHTVEWDELNTAGMIFGKSYTGGSVDYTLRAPSCGSWYTGSGDSERGTPQSNEWDAVLDKNSGYVKNWYRMYSWGQDTSISSSRAIRGYSPARSWSHITATNQYVIVGFRPVLEVLNTDALSPDGLKAVTLDLNGGKLGGSTDDIQIIVKNGAAFTAPASDGLTAPQVGYSAQWQDSDGNLYAPGDSVPAGVTLLTAKWTNSVSTEDELREALDAGETSIKLVGDINLSSTLDLTDKNITLDLNGYVLTGNIQLADSSASPDSILTLIDSNPTATHADSSLPVGGVVKGNITLTRGSGSVSHLYANGGTVTGQTSLPSYAGGIFCTSDTPTAFTGYVGNYGEIHGGIFYAGINESCIKENTVTFMNGDSRYALEVVASGNKVVAPVSTPLKARYDFVGWYNGDTKYEFNQTITSDITLTAQWTPAEQFNLTPGGTYWFDLSGENIPGTVNTGNSYGAVSVPDTTLHYVPFTYAGTVDAYKLTSEMVTTEDYATQNKYPHSLFVADYAVTHTVSWNELNNAGLIFGKSYTGGSVDYTLRAPSGGSRRTGSGDSQRGTPQSNEWDAVLDKNSGYIKNWYYMLSWGQDTASYNSSSRAFRGHDSARYWNNDYATNQYAYAGFRPVLEVLSTDALGSDGLKAVTLDLNGGKLGGSADDIQIIVKNGAAFTAPASDGLTAPQVGYSAQWQDSDGNLYAPGDSVPAGVTTLTAQWTPDTYTVTLHLNDGTIANGKDVTEYTYGTGATLPTADDITRAGHTFEGWYEDENFSGSPVTEISATDTGKKEFYAKWEQKANAGLSVDAVPEKTYGDPAFQLNVRADSDGKVTYSSDNEDTATVDENGTVTIHQVGTATLTIRVAETAKYLPGEVTVTITVVRKNATLTVDKLTYSVTYGDADFIIGYASEGESSVTFTSSNEKVATVDKNGVVHIVSAGSATITLNMEQSGNYNAVSKKVEVIVAPKAITVTADNQTKTYGADDPKLTYTADGLVNGDTLTGIALTREAGTNVGQYDITLSQQTGANPNYSITFVKGALTIQPLAAELTWGNTSLTYNGKVQKPTAAVSNLLPGDTCTVTVTGGQTDAGSYTATATALSNGNYTLPANVTADFNIAPKDITVTITPNGGVYAGTITPATAELTGVCDGDTVEVTLTYTGTANDGTVVNSTDTPALAGTYTVTATIADSNYNLTGTNTAEFVVAKANTGLSVGTVPEKTYGDAAFKLDVHADSDGKVTYSSDNEDTATVDEDGNVTLHNVGTATLTVEVAETANYEGGKVTVTITVVRKNATLTVEKLTDSVTYGDADFIIGYASEGESSVTFTSSNEKVATVDKNGVVHIVSAGSATITLNMEQSGNYNAVSKKVEVIVAPKAITVTADNQTKIYDEDDPELTYTAVGLVGEDTLTGITLTRADGENAGEYDITASQADGANPNYEITFVPGTLTIAARDIADAEVGLGAALIANGKTQEQNIQRVTVKNAKGEELEVTYTVTGNQATEPGAYTMTITGTGNFTGTVTKTFVIAPAADSKVDTNENGDVVIGKGTISVEVVQETGAPEAEIRTGKAAIIEMLVASGDLTAEELSQVGDGASIRVLLKVTVASTTITEESKAQIEKAAEGYVIGQYIDISLFKQTIYNGQAGELIRLTGTYEEMEISLVVPENLLNRDNSVTRTFWIIRNHDGKVEFLPATYDAQTNTLTFKTDKFSDYAIVYKDAKKAAENPAKPDNTATGTSPQTGDPAILWIWFVLLFISCGGVITTIYIGKRKKDKAE